MGSPKRAGAQSASATRQAAAPARAAHPRTFALLVFGAALLTGAAAWHGSGALWSSRASLSGRWSQRGMHVLTANPVALLAGGLSSLQGAGAAEAVPRRQLGAGTGHRGPAGLGLPGGLAAEPDPAGSARAASRNASSGLSQSGPVRGRADPGLSGGGAHLSAGHIQADGSGREELASSQPKCAVLAASDKAPLGPPDAARNPLCGALRDPGLRSVAVVGNGPLDNDARRGIDAADVVVRFNLMNNWRRFEEGLDIWVIRFSTEATLRYWGLTNLKPEDAARVINATQAVWLVGGKEEDAVGLVERVPALQGPGGAPKAVAIPLEPVSAAYLSWLGLRDGSPSTGFVGIKAVLQCTAPEVVVHLYGMNWHEKNWRGHKMAAERAHWAPLEAAGRLVVQGTPCHGMRECGAGDLDQSCHWEGGRYLCIWGKPRRWTDFTGLLETGRAEEFLHPPPADARPAAGRVPLPRGGSAGGAEGGDAASGQAGASGTQETGALAERVSAGEGEARGAGASNPDSSPRGRRGGAREASAATREDAGQALTGLRQNPGVARQGRPLRKHGALLQRRERAQRASALPADA